MSEAAPVSTGRPRKGRKELRLPPDSHAAGPLVKLDTARRLLAQAKTVDEIKAIRDQAEAARLYARARDMGLEAQNYAAEIKLRAERRLGEVERQTQRNNGGRPRKTASLGEAVSAPPTLAELGITSKQSMNFQQMAALPEATFEQHIEQTRSAGQELTTAGMLRVARQEQERDAATELEAAIEATDDGTVARARLRAAVSQGVRDAGELFMIDPLSAADVLKPGDWPLIEQQARVARDWYAAVLAARVTDLTRIRRT